MKQSFYTLIKPNDWKIPEQATQHHGITTEECETFGLDIKIPILWFSQMCYMASEIVIYNSGFDDNLIECEYLRLNKEHYISPAKVKCCMRPCTELLRLPNPRGFSGFKWPKLEEAYHFFFNKEMPKAHNAMADTLHTRDIYLELRRRNHV
jgi:DNA polymerase III epsilon subunit-like protein